MNSLAIETSGAQGSVAFLAVEEGARPAFPRDAAGPGEPRGEGPGWRWREAHFTEGPAHARSLFPALDALLAAPGGGRERVDAIFASIGPGSYTGIRVGLAAAKTLAEALPAALVGIESLEVIARGAPPHDGPLVPILDARMDQVYFGIYERRGDGVVRYRGPEVAAADAFPPPPPGSLRLGSGAFRVSERAPAGAEGTTGPAWAVEPRARFLLEAGLDAWRAGARDDRLRLLPLYLRASGPEVKRARAAEAGR